MTIREQIRGAVLESHALLSRGVDKLSISGRSLAVILGQESRALPGQNVGLVSMEGATFFVLKSELVGISIDSILNQVVQFQNKTYRVVRATDNGLRWGLECEAKDAKR
jgi:hypothetical protein